MSLSEYIIIRNPKLSDQQQAIQLTSEYWMARECDVDPKTRPQIPWTAIRGILRSRGSRYYLPNVPEGWPDVEVLANGSLRFVGRNEPL